MSRRCDGGRLLAAGGLLIGLVGVANAEAPKARDPAPIQHVTLPGRPFSTIPSADGQWFFVASGGPTADAGGIAVLRKTATGVSLRRLVPTPVSPLGMALTHDGKMLIAAASTHILFLDVARLVEGARDVLLGSLAMSGRSGAIMVNVSGDDHYLFVAEESAGAVTVVDLAKARAGGFARDAIIGTMPVGVAPVALVFSSDERYLYATVQHAPRAAGWPNECAREGPAGESDPAPHFAKGAVVVIDVERAKTSPAGAIVATVPAGCNPVRLALGPKGSLAFVTARKDNAVLVLDTSKLIGDGAHAVLGKVVVGQSPVGIAADREGRRLYVTSSSRFTASPDAPQFVTVIDAGAAAQGKLAVLGRFPAGVFPRELALTPDQTTLIVGNYLSKTVEFVDLARAALAPASLPASATAP